MLRFGYSVSMVFLLAGCGHWPSSADKMTGRDSVQMDKAQNTVVEGSQDGWSRLDALQQRLESMPPVSVDPGQPDISDNPAMQKLIDINVVNASVSELLSALADQLHMNLMIDPKVTDLPQRSTLNMHHVFARDVLARIFEMFDIDGQVKGGVISAQLITHRTFFVDMLAAKSQLNIDDGGDVFGSSGKQSGSSALKGNALIAEEIGGKSDPSEDLSKSIGTIIGDASQGGKKEPDSYYSFDRATGTLFVSGRPSRVRAVGEFLDQLRRVRKRQIQIEAQLIDVTLTDAFNLGVDWNLLSHNLTGRLGTGSTTINSATTPLASGGLAGSSRTITLPAETLGSSTGYGNGLSYSSNSFSAAIEALRTFGTVRSLSNPVVRLSNGVPAYLSVGTNYRYITKVNNTVNNLGSGSSTNSTDVETDSLFSGVVVGVAAFVNQDGKIELFVHPMQTQVSPTSLNLVAVGTTGSAVTLPVIAVKGITTTLKLGSGETVMIGGLISQLTSTSNNGVPGLADIPALGSLFDTQSSSHQSEELVIVLRARLLN